MANVDYGINSGGNPFNPGDWNWKSPRTYVDIVSGTYQGYSLGNPSPNYPNYDYSAYIDNFNESMLTGSKINVEINES